MIICVTADEISMSSLVGDKFGRCRYLHFVDSVTREVTTLENGNHNGEGGVGIQVAQTVISEGAKAVITGNIGPNAAEVLKAAQVLVYTGKGKSIERALDAQQNKTLKSIDAQ